MARQDRRRQQEPSQQQTRPQQREKNTVATSILAALGLDIAFATIFSSFKDTIVAPVMKKMAERALNGEHRKIFSDIVYFQLTPEETRKIRNRLNKAKRDYTEDRMVALLAGMFNIYPSEEKRVEYIKKLEAMDDVVFKEFLYSAEHDPIEQLIFRLGDIIKETAGKTAQDIGSAGKKAFDGLKEGARWTDAKVASAAPHLVNSAKKLARQPGGSEWRRIRGRRPSLLAQLAECLREEGPHETVL